MALDTEQKKSQPNSPASKSPKKDYESPLDTPIFIMTLGIAIFGDILSIIPVVGDLFLIGIRLEFYLMGINSLVTNGGMVGGAIVEAVPAVSALPACTAYVVLVYMEERAKENVPDLAEAEQKIAPKVPLPKA